jgi:hypothetical protein
MAIVDSYMVWVAVCAFPLVPLARCSDINTDESGQLPGDRRKPLKRAGLFSQDNFYLVLGKR